MRAKRHASARPWPRAAYKGGVCFCPPPAVVHADLSVSKKMEQHDLFGEIEPPHFTIRQSAMLLGVCPATVRNWIKTQYLTQDQSGRITRASLARFQTEVLAREKLTQRANKSLKDTHDHAGLAARLLAEINRPAALPDKLGMEYEAGLSDSFRNREGIYYTPAHVARDLFSAPAGDIRNASFCDPCCGSGNFIVRALELGFQPQNIHGYDSDPVAVEITKARIYKLSGYQSPHIKVADFLKTWSACGRFDFIYTNPPWGKKIARQTRAETGSRLQAGGSIDSCSLFFLACLQCLKENGELGLLLPESFFNIAVFEETRIKALQLSIERLIDYGKIFKGLVTKAQAIVLKNRPPSTYAGISCEIAGSAYQRSQASFASNPKSILNLYCDDQSAHTLQHLLSLPHITLKDRAAWGLGIVTGNNKKFIRSTSAKGHIPVYRGADILPGSLQPASSFIPSDLDLYQQVAPVRFYEAKEKLIYRFISSRLVFFYDDQQRHVLNSANMLVPHKDFPITTKMLAELLNSDFMNWVFTKLFNTHKILRGDLESLPIHSGLLANASDFDEARYLEKLDIEKHKNGAFRIKK